VAQHRPTGSETAPPYAPRSSRFSSEPPSVEDDVNVRRYAILELHARNDDDDDDESSMSLMQAETWVVHVLISLRWQVRWMDVGSWQLWCSDQLLFFYVAASAQMCREQEF